MTVGKVYSYSRFSAAKQAHGASTARQADYARKWANEHGLDLDESLSMRDEGLSAYHQKHVKSGALGIFLAAVTAGEIPPGSVLIVEGLDRLSRAEPLLAQAQLTQIINADITVVTASDGKQYNREKLKANPMDLVYSLLVMIRAHEESETKSKRVGDAVRRKCIGWQDGTYRGRIVCGNPPSWIRWNGTAHELHPEMAPAIREVLLKFIEGYGAVRILQELADKGVRVTGEEQPWNISRLCYRDPGIFAGNRVVKVAGEEFRLSGYYPALLTEEECARLQIAAANRKRAPRAAGGKSEYPGIFTGLGIATCGACGAAIVSQNHNRKSTKNGTPYLYRRLRCQACEIGANKLRQNQTFSGCAAKHIERAILDYCSDQFNLESLLTGGSKLADLKIEHAAVLGRIANLEQKQAKFVDAALNEDTALPAALIAKMRDIEAELKREQLTAGAVAANIKALANTPDTNTAALWSSLRDGVLGLDYEARMKCRQLIEDTFSKVTIYFRGTQFASGGPTVNLVLSSKTGEQRLLVVDRKTGETISATQVLLIEDTPVVRVVKARTLTK